jgi:hypothetical protein
VKVERKTIHGLSQKIVKTERLENLSVARASYGQSIADLPTKILKTEEGHVDGAEQEDTH